MTSDRDGTPKPLTRNSKRGLLAFATIGIGQTVSGIGSAMTLFSLGSWLTITSGSVTQLSFLYVLFMTPLILLSPSAGTIVDRKNKRSVMLLADATLAVVIGA